MQKTQKKFGATFLILWALCTPPVLIGPFQESWASNREVPELNFQNFHRKLNELTTKLSNNRGLNVEYINSLTLFFDQCSNLRPSTLIAKLFYISKDQQRTRSITESDVRELLIQFLDLVWKTDEAYEELGHLLIRHEGDQDYSTELYSAIYYLSRSILSCHEQIALTLSLPNSWIRILRPLRVSLLSRDIKKIKEDHDFS